MAQLRTPTVLSLLVFFIAFSAPAQQELRSPEREGPELSAPKKGGAEKSGEEKSCLSREVEAVTDRPTISTSTETTQCGVVEFLAGPERVWVGHGLHQDDLAQALQFGVTRALDFHYAGTGFFTTGSAHAGDLSGVSDTNLGLRYRVNKQRRRLPSFGAVYNVKVPTASPRHGLSTGRYDHQVGFLAGKDIHRLHLDLNVIPQVIGRPDRSGFDRNTALIFFGSVPLTRKVTLVGGGFGFTSLNFATPAYASSTIGLTWRARSNLIFDAGVDEGLTSFAPRKRVGFGVTYAPANAYRLFLHDPEPGTNEVSSNTVIRHEPAKD